MRHLYDEIREDFSIVISLFYFILISYLHCEWWSVSAEYRHHRLFMEDSGRFILIQWPCYIPITLF